MSTTPKPTPSTPSATPPPLRKPTNCETLGIDYAVRRLLASRAFNEEKPVILSLPEVGEGSQPEPTPTTYPRSECLQRHHSSHAITAPLVNTPHPSAKLPFSTFNCQLLTSLRNAAGKPQALLSLASA